MNRRRHPYLLGGLVAVGAVLLFVSGGTALGGVGLFVLVFLLGLCFALMFFMVRGMGGGGDTRGHQHGSHRPNEFEGDSRFSK